MLAAPGRTADFHDAYACPLPTIVIAQLLGIPPEDLARFKQMSTDLTATYNLPDPAASAGPRAAFDEYFQSVIEARRAHPTDDLVSRLAAAEVDGRRLTDRELQWMLLLLLLGGNETSTALLTNLTWRLLQVPARWAAVRDDPALAEIAVEESLRFDPPVLGLFRTPTHDVTLHGVTIPEKAKVMVCFASANHDGAVFHDAETYRLDRALDEARHHLSFGFGAHFCPGAALARLEARITLRRLVARVHLGCNSPASRSGSSRSTSGVGAHCPSSGDGAPVVLRALSETGRAEPSRGEPLSLATTFRVSTGAGRRNRTTSSRSGHVRRRRHPPEPGTREP